MLANPPAGGHWNPHSEKVAPGIIKQVDRYTPIVFYS